MGDVVVVELLLRFVGVGDVGSEVVRLENESLRLCQKRECLWDTWRVEGHRKSNLGVLIVLTVIM